MEGYVIEMTSDAGAAAYYAVDAGRRFGQPHAWIDSPLDALRFARAQDAEAFRATFIPGSVAYTQVRAVPA